MLVTGAGGLVGGALCRSLVAGRRSSGREVHGTVRARPAPAGVTPHQIELSLAGAFSTLVDEVQPDVVVHAAYSTGELERDVVRATMEVAAGCAVGAVPLIHISTDAVFDGDHAPYAEDDIPEPLHPYGEAKRRAELAVVEVTPNAAIVRTALIVHLALDRPDTATQWVLDTQARGEAVTLFTDEFRTVVRLDDLVAALIELAGLDTQARRGYWHVAGPERLSRWELGQILADRYELDRTLLIPGLASSMTQPRPRDVSLTCDRMMRELSIRPRPVATVPDHGETTL